MKRLRSLSTGRSGLFNDKAGSQRDVDDAIAQLDIASKSWEAAAERKQLLDQLTLESGTGIVVNIPVQSPRDGTLRTISSAVDQTVSLAAPLFEVVSLDTLWVRVPIYPGQRNDIAAQKNALIRTLGGEAADVTVTPVEAPPGANALAATVDLFFELSNSDRRFNPGERVEVVLPLKGDTESLVVPRAAILRDIHGVAWVYVKSAEHTYERHRAEVHFTTNELSVLSRGPDAGTSVVVDGAAELFGTEFGAGK